MAKVRSPASSPSSENVPLASVVVLCPPPVTSASGTPAPVPMSVTMPYTVPGSAGVTSGGSEPPLPPLPLVPSPPLAPPLPPLPCAAPRPPSPQAARLQLRRITATERLSFVLMILAPSRGQRRSWENRRNYRDTKRKSIDRNVAHDAARWQVEL